MKIVSLAIVITCVVYSEGWVAIYPKHPTYKGNATCYMDGHGLGEFEDGETKRYDDACIKARCGSSGVLRITGCGALSVQPPCYVTKGDLSLPHPKCCHKIICPEDNKV